MSKNNTLSIDTKVSYVKNESVNISGIISKFENLEMLTSTALWQDLLFSIKIDSSGKLLFTKLFTEMNNYYSNFNEFTIIIRDFAGIQKFSYSSNAYLFSEISSSLDDVFLKDGDTLSIITKSYSLTKFGRIIYKTKEMIYSNHFEYISGTIIKISPNIVDAQAIHNKDMILVSGVTFPNTSLNLVFNDEVISLHSDTSGNFNYILPNNLPIGFNLTLKSPGYAPSEVIINYDFNKAPLFKDKIDIYGNCNDTYKLSTITLNPYTKEIHSKSHLKGILSLNNKVSPLSFKLYNNAGTLLLKKTFRSKNTSLDISKCLNKIQFDFEYYLEIESNDALLSFNDSLPQAQKLLFKINETGLTLLEQPKISLDCNNLIIETTHQQCEAKIIFEDTVFHENILNGKSVITLPKDLPVGSAITVTLLYEDIYSLPITVYSSYQSKNKQFIFNIDNTVLNSSSSLLSEEAVLAKDTYLTSKYTIPIYFYEKSNARVSISGNLEGSYSIYLLNDSGCQYLDKFNANEKVEFSIPKSGILLFNFKNLSLGKHISEDKFKITLKPLNTFYRSIPVLDVRENVFKNKATAGTMDSFINLLNDPINNNCVSIIKSNLFSLCLFNQIDLIDNSPKLSDLLEVYLYNYIENTQKEKLDASIKRMYEDTNTDVLKNSSFSLSLKPPKYIDNSIIIDGSTLPSSTINIIYANDLFKFKSDDRGIFNIDLIYKENINSLKLYLENKTDSYIINEGLEIQLLANPFNNIEDIKKIRYTLQEEISKSKAILNGQNHDGIEVPINTVSIGNVDINFKKEDKNDKLLSAMISAKNNLFKNVDN